MTVHHLFTQTIFTLLYQTCSQYKYYLHVSLCCIWAGVCRSFLSSFQLTGDIYHCRCEERTVNNKKSKSEVQSRGSCLIRIGVLQMDWLCRSSRHRMYSLNWDESTPPPQDALMLKPFWNRRSRTYGQMDSRCVSVSGNLQVRLQWSDQCSSQCVSSQLH